MKQNIYSIFDAAAGVYNVPFFQNNDALALRAFSDLANDQDTTIGRHPNDYTLYRIGTFNIETGLVEAENPASLANAGGLVHTAAEASGLFNQEEKQDG